MSARVLVIDDSPTVLRLTEAVLRGAGYEVACAGSGAEGLEAVGLSKPDLVLVDFAMPHMTGYQFCQELSRQCVEEPVPVVMMTTKGEASADRFARPPGVADFIAKPFSPEAILAVTSHVLEQRSGRRLTQPPSDLAPEAPAGAGDGPDHARLVDALVTALETHAADQRNDVAVRQTCLALDEALGRWRRDTAYPHQLFLSCALEEVALPDVLQLLQIANRPGLLEVRGVEGIRYDLYLRGHTVGAVVARNNPPEYQLGRIVVDRGLMTPSELKQLVASASGSSSMPLGEKLVRLGLIEAEDLRRAITQQCCELTYEALRLRHGRCRFWSGVALPAAYEGLQVEIDLQELLLEGLRRVDEWAMIERVVDSFDTVFAHDRPRPETLTSDERRLLHLIDGRRNVRELVTLSRMRPFECCRLLYRLGSSRQVRPAGALEPPETKPLDRLERVI